MEPPAAEPASSGDFIQAPTARAPAYQHVLAVLVALVGGLLGIIGAFFQEAQTTLTYVLLPFIGAPLIEEALKPSGIYLAMLWWPRALRNQLFTAVLCALSGLVFGIIESLVYVTPTSTTLRTNSLSSASVSRWDCIRHAATWWAWGSTSRS